jgi:acyl-CoA reductase-like NAD-dependent aldehyde dehydrogenase
MEAGMVFVNNYMRRAFLGTPFGGVKGSGFGRENAAETLREFAPLSSPDPAPADRKADTVSKAGWIL